MDEILYILLGQYADHSGVSEVVYGPYIEADADEIVSHLDAGQWYGMFWQKIEIGFLPGELRRSQHDDLQLREEQQRQQAKLWEQINRRQQVTFDPSAEGGPGDAHSTEDVISPLRELD